MNECNQTDEYNAVLRTKMCVRVIAIMALAAAAVLVVSAGVGAAATTWYVDDDGGAGIDYMKIQDAVDAAGDGDTIEVRSGTYYESVDINRRLVLRGVDTGEGKPVVDAEGDRSPIAVMVDGCTVDGFNVTVSDDEWEDAGILVESSNNTIKNNLINFNQDPDGDTTSWDNGADPDDDGIGDTPYVIDANIQDENPLMSWSEGLDRVIFITPAQTDRLVYGTNENISIDCVLQDDMGHNVTVDNVYATIKKPDSYSEQVSLAETTTGNYNGTFGNSSLAGRYSITIHATTVGAVNDTAELSFEVASSFIDGWVVNETEIHCNEIIVLNGDLTIENGGNLTLRNVTLRMDCDYDGQHHIEVKDGGAFYVYDNDNDPATPEDASVITALNPDQGYLFRVNAGSTFQMKNSELHGCGYEYNSLTCNHAGLWINSNDVVIENNLITNNYNGVLLCSSSNNTLANNTISFNDRIGVYLRESDNNTVKNCNTSHNGAEGVYLYDSNDNTICDIAAISNKGDGIYIRTSDNNKISGVDASSNGDNGICIDYSHENMLSGVNAGSNNDDGIKLCISSDNILTCSIVSNNHRGIHLDRSSDSLVINNIVCSNDAGIYLHSADNNRIYHNNLINNDEQAYDDGDTTSWDNGPIIGGNYRDDYTGTDPDDDGIGNTPCAIDADSQDEYPLMSWSEGLDKVIFITPAQTDRLVYGINENIAIDCIVQDDMGHNVTVDNVYATIKKPDSHSEQVSLAETTTGNYNGTFGNSSLAGSYSITIHATMVGAVNDTAELIFEVALSFIDGWVVNETEIHCNEIIVLNGDLTIENGGNLTLRNVVLMMNCDYDGQHHIEVKDGGAFHVYDNDNDPATPEDASVITALNPDQGYLFRVNAGSTFQMKNSELHGCGYEYNSLTCNHAGLWINSNDVVIENNLITNNYNGVLLCSSSNNTLANNTISFNDRIGVYLIESDNNTVKNCDISHNGAEGVYLHDSNDNTLKDIAAISNKGDGIYIKTSNNNRISGVDASSNGDGGIAVLYSCNNTIFDSISTSNKNDGINLYYSNCSNIESSEVAYNNDDGVYLCCSYNNTIYDIAAISNKGDGIYIKRSGNNRISGVDASSNGDDGITVSYSCNNNIFDSISTSNKDDGINLYYSNCSNIESSEVTCNNDDGVYLYYSDNNTIYDIAAISNKGDGIYIKTSGNNRISGVDASSNGDDGITVVYSCNNNIFDSISTSNNDDGVDLYYSNCSNIESSEVTCNNDDGVYLYYSDNNTIYDIAAISNKGDGVYIEGSGNNKISGVDASSNGDDGINVSYSCNNNIFNSISILNKGDGVYIEGSGNNKISGVDASSNDGNGITCTNSSSNNLLYHNNLIDNTGKNAYDRGTNQWSSITAGNYYSNYNGNDSDSNGIGEDPYPIPGGESEDCYPLMKPWHKPYTPGDLNDNNEITSLDALMIPACYGRSYQSVRNSDVCSTD